MASEENQCATSRDEVKEEYAQVAKRAACGQDLGAAETNHEGVSDERGVYSEEDVQNVPEKSLCCCRGCANPFNRAELETGMRVLDLGCGAGTDAFIAAAKVGESGKVVGLDMTQEMIDVANEGKAEKQVKNVEFVKGYLEELPFEDGSFDYVLSNCVINLCTDKTKVLKEAFRVLAGGGKMVATDLVIENTNKTSDDLLGVGAVLGATSGVLLKENYEQTLKEIGFKSVDIEEFEIYSSCSLKSIAKDKDLLKNLEGFSDDEINNVFASSYVKASK